MLSVVKSNILLHTRRGKLPPVDSGYCYCVFLTINAKARRRPRRPGKGQAQSRHRAGTDQAQARRRTHTLGAQRAPDKTFPVEPFLLIQPVLAAQEPPSLTEISFRAERLNYWCQSLRATGYWPREWQRPNKLYTVIHSSTQLHTAPQFHTASGRSRPLSDECTLPLARRLARCLARRARVASQTTHLPPILFNADVTVNKRMCSLLDLLYVNSRCA